MMISLIDIQLRGEFVYLQQTNISDESLQYLTLKTKGKHVKCIYLGHNNITPRGIQHFIRVRWENLTALYLWENQIGARGCKILSQSDFPQLIQLSLGNNAIQSQGVFHLSKASWKNLEQFNIHKNKIGTNATKWISKCDWMKLKSIDLGMAYDRKMKIKQLLKRYRCWRWESPTLKRQTYVDVLIFRGKTVERALENDSEKNDDRSIQGR